MNNHVENDSPLTFGSIIALGSPQYPNSYVYIDGFVKMKIRLKNFEESDNKKQYSKCLFQIYPYFVNKYKKQALQIRGDDNKILNEKKESRILEIVNDLQEKILIEFKFNHDSYKKVTGTPILFNQPIQLLHIASNKYLSCKLSAAELELENYKLTLDEYPSEDTIFKIVPSYKYQKEGEGIIFINDNVAIQSAKSTKDHRSPFVHISNPIYARLVRQKTILTRDRGNEAELNLLELKKSINFKKTAKNSRRPKIEINASSEASSRFKMYRFSEYIDENTNYLCCGDIIWLNHSEVGATLIAKQYFKADNTKSKEFIVEFDLTQANDNYNQFIGNTNGMWIVEDIDYTQGGYLKWNTPYKLRHLSSGLYLCSRKDTKSEKKTKLLLQCDREGKNDETNFEFKPLKSTLSRESLAINKGAYMIIRTSKEKLAIHPAITKKASTRVDRPKVKSSNNIDILKGGDHNLCEPLLTLKFSDEDAFKIIKANYTEVWETNFLISCLPILQEFLEELIVNNQAEIFNKIANTRLNQKLRGIFDCIHDLNLFCNNKLFNTLPDQKYGESNLFRQTLLREQSFIDISVFILKEILQKEELEIYEEHELRFAANVSPSNFMRRNKNMMTDIVAHGINDKSLSENEIISFIAKKIGLCLEIYSLLINVCNNNPENQLYTFNLIPYFLKHCKYLPKAVDCIISIIGNNSELLTKISENTKTDDAEISPEIVEQQNFVNIIINLKDKTGILAPKDEMFKKGFNQESKVSKPINLINYFINLLRDRNRKPKYHQYLKFLRSICAGNLHGMAINQEVLYKFVVGKQNYMNKYLIFFKVENEGENPGKMILRFPTADYLSASGESIHCDVVLEDYHEGKMNPLSKVYDENLLEQQLRFYTDMSFDRNYLWKSHLEDKFPSNYLFKILNKKKIPEHIRSAMFVLAFTLYLDHEPFNDVIAPNMCRISAKTAKKNKKKNQQAGILKQHEGNLALEHEFIKLMESQTKITKRNLEELLMDIEDFIGRKISEIEIFVVKNAKATLVKKNPGLLDNLFGSSLFGSSNKQSKRRSSLKNHHPNRQTLIELQHQAKNDHKQILIEEDEKDENNEDKDKLYPLDSSLIVSPANEPNEKAKDILNNDLLLNVINLYSKMIKFDILNVLNKKDHYPILVQNFVRMLEYEQNFPTISKLLVDQRSKNMIQRTKEVSTMSIFKGAWNLVGSVVSGVGDIGGTMLSFIKIEKNKKKKANQLIDETDDQIVYNNPIMRSMLSLKYSLDKLKVDENTKTNPAEIAIKLEILNTLDFLLDLRKDYLISNFIEWYLRFEKKMQKQSKSDIFFRKSPQKKKNSKKNSKKIQTEKLEQENLHAEWQIWENKLIDQINNYIGQVMPNISRTGILALDEKYNPKITNELLTQINKVNPLAFVDKITGGANAQKITKRFKNFCSPELEMPDLDTLMLGRALGPEDRNKISEILPSLLVTFLVTTNSSLEGRTLDIIMRLFNQRAELIHDINNLEIIFDENEKSVFNFLRDRITRLRIISEQSEAWLPKYVQGLQDDKSIDECIMHTEEITRLMFQNYNIHQDNNNNNQNRADKIEESEDYVSESRQNIARFCKGHESFIELIKNGMHHLGEIILDHSFDIQKKYKIEKLFRLSHRFLQLFCQQNPKNQKLLAENKDIFIHDAHLDVGQIDLLCEIYRDNKPLCTEITDSFIKKFISLIETEGRQANFLKFFVVIQKCKGFYIPENQALVFRNLVFTDDLSNEKQGKLLYSTRLANNYNFHFEDTIYLNTDSNLVDALANQGFTDTYRDEPFIYHAQLLDVLINSMNGRENYSTIKSKLRNFFSVDYLFDILLHMDLFIDGNGATDIFTRSTTLMIKDKIKELKQIQYKVGATISDNQKLHRKLNHEAIKERNQAYCIIKPKILEFLYELYLDSDKKIIDDYLLTSKYFLYYLETERSRLDLIKRNTPLKIDPSFYNYYFEWFLIFCDCFVNKVLSDAALQTNSHRKDNVIFYKLALTLSEKITLIQDKLTPRQVDIIYKFISNYEIPNEEEDEKVNEDANGVNDQANIVIPKRKIITQSYKQYKFEDLSEMQPNEQQPHVPVDVFGKTETWDLFLEYLAHSFEVKEFISEEKLALAETIINFEKLIPLSEEEKEAYGFTFETKDILQKIITFLQFGQLRKAKKNTMISAIQILVKILDKEDPDERREMQNLLDKYDATKMVLTVLSDAAPMDLELLSNFMLLGIMLLEGGNIKIQKEIHNYFLTFPKSENIFAKFHTTISNQVLFLNLQESGRIKEEEIIEEFLDLKPLILERTMHFLQLMTEGHFLELQNYIRHQVNSRNTHDIIGIITELLKGYLYPKNLNAANYENILRCIETLTEFVQGPCQENQVVLIDGKFFEAAKEILEYMYNEKDYQEDLNIQKGKKTHHDIIKAKINQKLLKWQISRLKHKTMVLVLSLLETRSEDSLVKRIMRALPMDTLKKNMIEVFKDYKEQYSTDNKKVDYVEEALNHYVDPDPMEMIHKKENKKYYDLITETGFLLYFLMEHYFNVHDFGQDKELIDEITKAKKAIKVKTGNILENNVLGQMGTFAYQMMKEGVNFINNLTNTLDKKIFKGNRNSLNEEAFRKATKEEEEKQYQQALKFFAKNSAHIEVIRDGNLEKIYFILHPFCHCLPKDIKREFHDTVNRASLKSKALDLLLASSGMIDIMVHEQKLKIFFGKNKLLALFANYVDLWKNLAFFMTLIINFFILCSFSDLYGDNKEYARLEEPRLFLQPQYTNTMYIISKLGIVMVICSLFVVCFFLIKKAPLIIQTAWKVDKIKGENKTEPKKGLIVSLISFLLKVLYCIFNVLKNMEVVYYIAYGVLAIIGVTVHPFFFIFHLTETLFRYPTLTNVIRSFWEPREALFYTLILFLIVEYCFSIIGFQFFAKYYAGNCQTLLKCFLKTFDQTFKNPAGIGNYLDDKNPSYMKSHFEPGRFIFDNFFNLILIVILLSITAGLIIDTFGDLRESENEKDKDIEEKCFICGFQREIFDRNTNDSGYTGHIKLDHYMWNYVNFIAYLRFKSPTEFTGIETYLWKKISHEDVSWFPAHKTIALENFTDEEDIRKKSLKVLKQKVNYTKETVERLKGIKVEKK